MIRVALAAVALAAAHVAHATTASLAELKIGMGARAAGMGDSYVGVADDAEAIGWNPAGLGELPGIHATVMHLAYFTQVNVEHAAASYAVAGLGTFGLSLGYLSAGDKLVDVDGIERGSFTNNAIGLAFGWGRKVSEGLSVGLAAKITPETLQGRQFMAGAFDLGAMYQPRHGMKLGLALQHAGARSDASLPMLVRGGLSYWVRKDLMVATEVVAQLVESRTAWHLGAEWEAYRQKEMGVAVRAGYSFGFELPGFAGFAVGAGLSWRAYSLDLAMTTYGVLGPVVRGSLSGRFGADVDHGAPRPGLPSARGTPAPAAPVLAVGSFANASGDTAMDWMKVAVPESLNTKLASFSGVKLVERTQVERALSEIAFSQSGVVDPESAPKLKRFLGATHLVLGQVVKPAPDVAVMEARVVRTETGEIMGGASVRGRPDKLFDLTNDLALKVASVLGLKPSKEEVAKMTAQKVINVEAYQAMADAQLSFYAGDYAGAKAKLQQALAKDPNNPLLKKQLGEVDTQLRTIAVLRFTNLTGNPAHEGFGAQVAEALGTQLTAKTGIYLAERGQIDKVLREQALGASGAVDEKSAPKIGKLVGAREVVVGSYSIAGTELQVNARILDTQTGQAVHAEQETGPVKDAMGVQRRLGEKLSAKILARAVVVAEGKERKYLAAGSPTAEVSAYKPFERTFSNVSASVPEARLSYRILVTDERLVVDESETMPAGASVGSKRKLFRVLNFMTTLVPARFISLSIDVEIPGAFFGEDHNPGAVVAQVSHDGKIDSRSMSTGRGPGGRVVYRLYMSKIPEWLSVEAKEWEPVSYHTVAKGASLADVAGRPDVYRNRKLWPLIARANPAQVKSGQPVKAGAVLFIPRDYRPEEAAAAMVDSAKDPEGPRAQ